MTRRWHGYPIPDDAHAERPWWAAGRAYDDGHEARKAWVRRDGVEIHENGYEAFCVNVDWPAPTITGQSPEAVMAYLDRDHPLPAPPPLVGDVWHDPEWGAAMILDARAFSFLGQKPVAWRVVWSNLNEVRGTEYGEPDPIPSFSANRKPWPPAGAVCVWGPSAPWGA